MNNFKNIVISLLLCATIAQAQNNSTFELSAEQIEKSEISQSKVSQRNIISTLSIPGKISLNLDQVAHVMPQIKGIITSIPVKLGSEVTKGDTLCDIDSRDLAESKITYLKAYKDLVVLNLKMDRQSAVTKNTNQLLDLLAKDLKVEVIQEKLKGLEIGENRARLITEYTNLKLERSIMEREKGLYDKKMSASADFYEAEANYKSTNAKYIALTESISYEIDKDLQLLQNEISLAKSNLGIYQQKLLTYGLTEEAIKQLPTQNNSFTKYSLLAPITGTILEKKISTGELVNEDRNIVVIADLSTVWVDVLISPDVIQQIKLGQKVIIQSNLVDIKTTGKLIYISPIVDESTKTITARIVLENKEKLWRPGLFVTANVVLEEKNAPSVVSINAIQNINGKNVVFVRNGNRFIAQPVKLGLNDGKYVEIIEGLAPGVEYVTNNSFVLKAHLLNQEAE